MCSPPKTRSPPAFAADTTGSRKVALNTQFMRSTIFADDGYVIMLPMNPISETAVGSVATMIVVVIDGYVSMVSMIAQRVPTVAAVAIVEGAIVEG